VRGRFYGVGPVGYRRADARILAEVNEALARDPWLNASGIHVTVQNGEVTLTGTVETPAEKRRAGQIAWNVLGVRDVHNRLQIAALTRPTEQPTEQPTAPSPEAGI
jgi:osmotically-inducible protein OsmY